MFISYNIHRKRWKRKKNWRWRKKLQMNISLTILILQIKKIKVIFNVNKKWLLINITIFIIFSFIIFFHLTILNFRINFIQILLIIWMSIYISIDSIIIIILFINFISIFKISLYNWPMILPPGDIILIEEGFDIK